MVGARLKGIQGQTKAGLFSSGNEKWPEHCEHDSDK